MAHPERRGKKLTGHWYGEVDLRHKALGVRFRRRFETKREAEGYEAYIRATGEEPPGITGSGDGRTFADVAKELKDAGGPEAVWAKGRDPSGMSRLETLRGSKVGKAPIAQVAYGLVEEYVSLLKKRPGKAQGSFLDARTINRYLSLVSAVNNYAEVKGYIERAPILPWQKDAKKKKQLYTDTQCLAVINHLRAHEHKEEAFCVDVLNRTGLRAGELLGLKPDQIDDEFINLDDPEAIKNEETRPVYIGEEMARELRALVASGALPNYSTLYTRVAAAVKACGYSIKRPIHAFRATLSWTCKLPRNY
jgi:integrase